MNLIGKLPPLDVQLSLFEVALSHASPKIVTYRKMILRACGASVKTLSDVQKGKGRVKVDCCLFASTSLPPHVISLPACVSKMLQFIAGDTPLLEWVNICSCFALFSCQDHSLSFVSLAWAHQSIIQRKCLPLDGDARFSIDLGSQKSNSCKVFSIKRAQVRNEVGDLVQFSRGSKTLSYGRIVGIILERQGNGCTFEVQLLVSNVAMSIWIPSLVYLCLLFNLSP